MTWTGVIVIPLALLLILLPWRYGFPALLILSTLSSAAVVNVGSFGLQPGYLFAILVIVRTSGEMLLFREPLNATICAKLLPLMCFLMIGVISLWIGLTFFQGRVMVLVGQDGFKLDLALPLRPQRQNFTQLFYLILNLMLVYALAHQLARFPVEALRSTADRAVVLAIVFSSTVAFWEMANYYWGVYFPSSFFHSNVAYSAPHGQTLYGLLRVSGPFTEPSALAYYYGGFVFFAWYRNLQRPGIASICLVLLSIAVMALSIATTAYLLLGVFALVLCKDLILAAICGAEARPKIRPGHLAPALVAMAVLIGAAAVASQKQYDVEAVLTEILFDKSYSSSFAQRIGAERMAMEIAVTTGGIGVGLGSHKANSLAMTILSNAGVPGLLAFGLFAFGTLWPQRGEFSRTSGLFQGDVRPLRWLVIGLLLGHAISNPNLNPIVLWIGFGLVIGMLAAGQRTVARPSHALRPIGNGLP